MTVRGVVSRKRYCGAGRGDAGGASVRRASVCPLSYTVAGVLGRAFNNRAISTGGNRSSPLSYAITFAIQFSIVSTPSSPRADCPSR